LPHRNIDEAPRPAGQRFLYWLAAAAVEARESAGEDPETIAYMLRVRAETVRRFEKAEHWPRDTERMIAAYAAVARIPDPRNLYERALELWHDHGTRPAIGGDDAAADPADPPAVANGRDEVRSDLPQLRARAKPLPDPRPARTAPPVRRSGPATDARSQRQRHKRA
jgi:hypothetical protein